MKKEYDLRIDLSNPLSIGMMVGLLRGDVIDAVIVFWFLENWRKQTSQSITLFQAGVLAAFIKTASWVVFV